MVDEFTSINPSTSDLESRACTIARARNRRRAKRIRYGIRLADNRRGWRRPKEYFPILSRVDYRLYLLTTYWAKKRVWAIRKNGGRCHYCQGDEHIQVHHLSYDRLWHERLTDLEVVCSSCHKRIHGIDLLDEQRDHLMSIGREAR